MAVTRASSGLWLTLATVVIAAGCYNPKIKNGGLKCNDEFYQSCPTGYYCDGVFCQKGPGDGAVVDRVSETKIDTPVEKMADVKSDVIDTGPCLTSVAGCTPDMTGGKKCDPLCQTGCGCHEKCSFNVTASALSCKVPAAGFVAKVGQSCDISFDGTAEQTDNCGPGLVCLHESCGDLCAKFCRIDADCPGSLCSRSIGGGLKVCDVATVECNPIGTGPYDCPAKNQPCYLSSTTPDRTFCDCPFNAQPPGGSCEVSRDCFGGLVCVDPTGGMDRRCRRVCSLTGAAGGACTVGTCRPLMGTSTKYGYCL